MTTAQVSVPTNPLVLKNTGVPVPVHALKMTDDGNGYAEPYERIIDKDGVPKIEKKWFKLTNAILLDFEADTPLGWGNLEVWQEAVDNRTYDTVSRTFALAWGLFDIDSEGRKVPNAKLAATMLLDDLTVYIKVLASSFAIAQGADPAYMGKALTAELKEMQEKQEAEVQKRLKELEKEPSASEESANDSPSDEPTQTNHKDQEEVSSSPYSESGQQLEEAGMSSGG